MSISIYKFYLNVGRNFFFPSIGNLAKMFNVHQSQQCESIIELPKLCIPNLEALDLSFCQNLVKVHESVGFLDKLKIWDLQGCEELQILPNNLRLKSLVDFILIHYIIFI